MSTINTDSVSFIQGKKPRSRKGKATVYGLAHTHNSRIRKSCKHDEMVQQSGKNLKHRALSPEYTSLKKHMTGQGRGSTSNGSTEADSNECNKENDFIGNFG